MRAAVRFTTAAELDLTAAFLWYEEQSVGLGARLMDCADAVLTRISETPLQFPEVTRGYRRALLHHFPYGVYFAIGADEIRVHAVLHLHRDPAHWQDRLAGGAG